MRPDKSGDGLAMALETKAGGQFIGCQLKVGRLLQRYKILQKPGGLRRPIGPMVATRKVSAEISAALYPASAQPVKMRLANPEVTAGFNAVDLPFIELLEDMLEKRFGKASGQLFFSQSREEQWPPLGRGFSSAFATLRPPQILDQGAIPSQLTAFSF
jgi:hypothetical protein